MLSRLYRRLFLERVRAAFNAGLLNFFGELGQACQASRLRCPSPALRSMEWVVYAKRPFGGPKQVLRYSHRLAIAN